MRGDPARASYTRHHTCRRIECQCQGKRAGPYRPRLQDSWRFHSGLLHSPGRPTAGGCAPDREQDGVVAVSFIDWCLEEGRVAPGRIRGEWVQVYNPCRVKTIHIVAYSVMYNSRSSPTNVVRTTYTFLPPSSTTFPARIAAEVRGVGVTALKQG